jgi:hypothetical protein
MSKYWYEYVKASYDLVIESEGQAEIFLEDEVEVYVVHLFARNFTRTDIGVEPIALQILQTRDRERYQKIADECLLINSFPLRRQRWPSDSYYSQMGITAYSMASIDLMEKNFEPASRVLNTIFRKIG